jgi:hypothetical protein
MGERRISQATLQFRSVPQNSTLAILTEQEENSSKILF